MREGKFQQWDSPPNAYDQGRRFWQHLYTTYPDVLTLTLRPEKRGGITGFEPRSPTPRADTISTTPRWLLLCEKHKRVKDSSPHQIQKDEKYCCMTLMLELVILFHNHDLVTNYVCCYDLVYVTDPLGVSILKVFSRATVNWQERQIRVYLLIKGGILLWNLPFPMSYSLS